MKKKYGRRVKDVTSMMQLDCDLRPTRPESYLFSGHKYDVTELMKYLEKQKEKGTHITFFNAFLAALGMTFYNRPRLNYFVKNRHIYEHPKVTFSFVAKVAFEDSAEEVMILCDVNPDDNIFSIAEKNSAKIEKIRSNAKNPEKKGANSAMDALAKLPNFLRVPIVGLFKWTDKIGYLPSFLAEDNVYYSSLLLSNLGSFKFDAIHHNISEFGICSGIATLGEVREEEVIIDGKKQKRKIFELGATFDERAADGFYLIKSLKLLGYILEHPELLEKPANTKINVDK